MGRLSGATPSEARSWGKVKDAVVNNVVVYSCASLTLPLLAQYVLVRNRPRPARRLYSRLAELTGGVPRRGREQPGLSGDPPGERRWSVTRP